MKTTLVREFNPARKSLLTKTLMPTVLGSEDLSAIDAKILRAAMFSARTANSSYLDKIKKTVDDLLNPKPVERVGDDGVIKMVTEGFNLATARLELKDALASIKYEPKPGEEGTIKDLSSDQRIELILKTNTEMAQGYGQMLQGQEGDVLEAFPAQELFRAEDRKEKRNWKLRWRNAAEVSGDTVALQVLASTGQMIALKQSPIWDALAIGENGDGLQNPYPPYAFNSGMWVRDIERDQAIELGLMTNQTALHPRKVEFKVYEGDEAI